MLDAALLSRVKSLDAADRLELLHWVWESFAPNNVSVTEDEKQLLDARLADAAQHPENQSPWREVQARLRQKPRHLKTNFPDDQRSHP